MKKLLSFAAVILTAGLVLAASGYAGRKVASITTSGSVAQTDTTAGQRVSSVSVKYANPATLTLYFYVTQSGVQVLRYQVALTAASSVVYVPEGLWLKYNDSLTVSNSVSSAALVVVDFTYE